MRPDNVIELDDLIEREYQRMQRITDLHYTIVEYNADAFESIELDANGERTHTGDD